MLDLTKNGTTYTYDAADRLTSTGGVSYVNDNNGNRTSRGADSFAWDGANRMTSATVGGTTTTLAYRGDSLRDSLTTGGNTTTFTWDVAAGMPQVLDDGAFKYVYGLGRIAEVSGSGTNYYLADAQDSVMALTNSAGSVLNTYNYDVFGAIRSSTGSQANPFTFTGEQTDAASGLEYLRMRYYDPATGGFASRDPVATSNRFNYAEGDPVNLTDPSGFCISQKLWDELQKKLQKLFASAGEGKWGDYWRKVWIGNLTVCDVEAAAKQCVVWGAAGALLGGAGAGFAWGCAAGAASSIVDRRMKPGPMKTFTQCGIYAVSAFAAAPRALGTAARGGIAASGCFGGAAGAMAPAGPYGQCDAWAAAGYSTSLFLRDGILRAAKRGFIGCVAGVIGHQIAVK